MSFYPMQPLTCIIQAHSRQPVSDVHAVPAAGNRHGVSGTEGNFKHHVVSHSICNTVSGIWTVTNVSTNGPDVYFSRHHRIGADSCPCQNYMARRTSDIPIMHRTKVV
jgi:hypothetical protein